MTVTDTVYAVWVVNTKTGEETRLEAFTNKEDAEDYRRLLHREEGWRPAPAPPTRP